VFRFSIRELLLITLAIGLGIAYLLSWHRERALRTEKVRLEWKLRVLESVPTASGKHLSDLVQDDGETLTITSEDGVSTFTPTRAIIQSADGGKGVATWKDPLRFSASAKS
jgi:hypothetical protein